MKVAATQAAEAAAAAQAKPATGADGAAFKAALDDADVKLRKGEEIEPVPGRRYAEITKGAREGMYLNTSGNARDGKAFVRVIEDGVEYHIYGGGEDRLTIANDLRDGDKPGIRLRKGERVERVEGRDGYVEIVSGPREGMFINASGNARHGEAFVRSVKDGVERHIYGSGDDRVVVSSGG
jgi:hypothetical protein